MAGYYQQQPAAGYTQQERDDNYTSRIEHNPNRVGSGYVNYGPQVRHQQPAPNWQTGNPGGAAPAQVSERRSPVSRDSSTPSTPTQAC